MPVSNKTKNCKKCGTAFTQLVKRGRPFDRCNNCRAKKETVSNV